MANLEKVGIELVSSGATQFVSAVTKAASSLNVLERASKIAAAGVNALNQVVIGALRRVGELFVDGLVRAGREALRFGQRVLQAAAEGTQFERRLESLGDRLLGVTRFNLDPLFDQLDGLTERASPVLEGFVNFLTRSFSTLAQNAVTYGENIAMSLANGLFAGAAFVVDALTHIANLITFWLAPGSPPRLLPDLDTWGTEAANVWLEGWAAADFAVFDQLAGNIEQLLRSQAAPGDTALIPTILGTREAIAQAVEQARTLGRVTEDSLQAIFDAAGAATPAMREFLESAFNLELADANVAAAQAELNRVTEEYERLLQPIDERLSAISEAQQQLTEDGRISQLELVENDPNATLAEKTMARLEIERILAERNRRALLSEAELAVDAAQEKVDAAEAAQTAAQAEYDAKLAQIQLQVEQNRLIQEQIALLERLAELAGGAAGGTTPRGPSGGAGGPRGVVPVRPAFDLSQFIPQELLDKFAALRTAAETAWAAIREKLDPVFDAFDRLGNTVDRIKNVFKESMPDIEAEVSKALVGIINQIELQAPNIIGSVDRMLNTITDIWEEHRRLILGIVGGLFVSTISITLGSFAILFGLTAAQMVTWEGIINTGLLLIQGDWQGAWDEIRRTNDEVIVLISAAFQTAMDGYLGLFGTSWDEIADSWELKLGALVALVGPWSSEIVSKFMETDWAQVGHDIIQGISDGITGAIAALARTSAEAAAAALAGAKAALGIDSPSKRGLELGANFGESIASGLAGAMGTIEAASVNMTGAMVAPPMSAAQVATSYAYSYTNAPVLHWAPTYNVERAPSEALSFEAVRAMWGR